MTTHRDSTYGYIADDPGQQNVCFHADAAGSVRSFRFAMRYLLESAGRLLMVRRSSRKEEQAPIRFEVFEADLTGERHPAGGRRCGACTAGRSSSTQGVLKSLHGEDVGEYSVGVYDMRDGMTSPLPLPESAKKDIQLHHQYPVWFFPTH
uniref:DUF295 domain-containing protein n=1 Tax=Oryza brachyantha TaxID=4533 RepID=J3NEK9_ORYBR